MTQTLSRLQWPALFSILLLIALLVPRSFAFILLVPGLIYYGIDFIAAGRLRIPSLSLLFFVVSFCSFAFISCLFSVDFSNSADRALKLLLLLGLGMLAVTGYQTTLGEALRGQKLLVHVCIAVCALTFIDIMTGMPLYNMMSDGVKEIKPHAYNRSTVALFLLIPPLVCLRFAGQNMTLKTVMRDRAMLALGLFLAALLVITESQGAQFTALLFVLFLAFPVRSKWAWRALKLALFAALLTAPLIATYLYTHFVSSDMLQNIAFFHKGAGDSRLEIWYSVAQKIGENPFGGYGIDSTSQMTLDSPMHYWNSNNVLHPHNFTLQLWIEFGLMGAFLGGMVLLSILQVIAATENIALRRIMLANFMGWISVAATGYGLWQSWWIGLSLTLLLLWMSLLTNSGQEKSAATSDPKTQKTSKNTTKNTAKNTAKKAD